MKTLLSLIQQFDSFACSPVDIFQQSKKIRIDIETAIQFEDIDASTGHQLLVMLESIVTNKSKALQTELEAKAPKNIDSTIKELFVRKTIKTLQNTQGSLKTPFCNTGVIQGLRCLIRNLNLSHGLFLEP